MAPESHPIMLLERIRNCRYYWQLNCFELLRLYLTCTHTPLDSAPSKPLRPLIHLVVFVVISDICIDNQIAQSVDRFVII